MNREDFPMLQENIVYFDNGATTYKPKEVINKTNYYYEQITSNAHRGDYDTGLKVTELIEETRKSVQEYLNALGEEEIIFTSGTTESINLAVFGYFANILKKGDEVILTKSEHASNLLPWFILKEKIGINLKYIPLTKDYEVTIANLKLVITPKTKVISLAHITNVIGDERPIKEITTLAHQQNILVLVDGAQSIAHTKIDVQDLDIDFLAFSAHKMYGPTGVGVLYGKKALLEKTNPLLYGGGMNASFTSAGQYELKELPTKLEAGTQNIAGIIAFQESIKYLKKIGINNIKAYENSLHQYLLQELNKLPYVKIYNKKAKSPILAFNIDKIFSQDIALYLNKYHLCVRAGNHCAKILKEELNVNNTCRISLSFYNTKEEIDLLINVLKNIDNIWKEIIS